MLEQFSTLLECRTDAAWQQALSQLGRAYGFEHTLFGITPKHPTSLGDTFIRGNFSPKWLAAYRDNEFIRIDPRLRHCENHAVPQLWEPATFTSTQQQAMYEEASAHGLCAGIALPVRTAHGNFGMLFFATSNTPSHRVRCDIMQAIPELSALRDFALESSASFIQSSACEAVPALTQKELECLKWCAIGKSTWEISKILGCSESTIKFHFNNLRCKFKTTSRAQVVA